MSDRLRVAVRVLAFPLAWLALAPVTARADHRLSTGLTDRELATHYAPVIYQDVADGLDNDPANFRRDFLTNVDFDGNWDSHDNEENLKSRAFPLRAYVYFDVIETATHYWIEYSYFHPEDWNSFGGTDHENDMENERVVVEKDGSAYGRFLVTDINAHGYLNAYTDRTDITRGTPFPANQYRSYGVQFESDAGSFSETFSESFSHLRVYLEPQGHGPASCAEQQRPVGFLNSIECNAAGGTDKVIYRVAANGNPALAQEPDYAIIESGVPAQVVSYGLLSGHEALWPLRQAIEGDAGQPRLWDSAFAYAPGRNADTDGANDFTLASAAQLRLGGEFAGDEGGGGGLPPWGFASVPGVPAAGDWLFDPAYATAVLYNFGAEHATGYCNYLFNPYLTDLLATAAPTSCGTVDEGSGGGCDVGGSSSPVGSALAVCVGALAHWARRRRTT